MEKVNGQPLHRWFQKTSLGRGGEFYTPACGSGGMFVQSAKFIKNYRGNLRDISVLGQEGNPTTLKVCMMNLAIRGIEVNLGQYNTDTFTNDQHKQLKADFVLANPPFNMDWPDRERLEERFHVSLIDSIFLTFRFDPLQVEKLRKLSQSDVQLSTLDYLNCDTYHRFKTSINFIGILCYITNKKQNTRKKKILTEQEYYL